VIGRIISHYKILEKLGSGGMGTVFRAKDFELGRDVAIKILREDLSADPERLRRFEQEARSASALNHPNIITIHEIGTDDSTPYIVMELVEGETLRETLDDGPLPTKKLLQVATQIAEGLTKAHAAGIVHRDLKPENLMITNDGFGLALILACVGLYGV
jgi:serine/threonine protein kinase